MIKKTLFLNIIFLTALTTCLYAEDAAEEMKESAFPIVINGDKVQFDHGKKIATGSGDVSITYKDMKMTCDRIIVDIDKKEGVAEGNVTMYQGSDVFTADKVTYDFEKKTGRLINGGMQMEPWYGKAPTIDKVDDKLFKLNDSYATTCEFDPPHYRIEAKTIKIYLGDRVTAWHVFFYAGNTPIMYAPYYNHPLNDNLPPVTLVPGRNDEWGVFLLSGWRYYFHPDSKGYVNLDWRSKRGFGKGIDYKYGLGKFGSGYATFYHMHDREPDESQELGTELPSERWRGALRHKWDVDENTVMTGEYHRLSDQDFIKDFFYKEEYEVDDQPDTYISLAGAKGSYTFTYLYRQKVNDFFTVTERLPEAQLNIGKIKLFDHLGLYYSNESSSVRLNKKHAKDLGRFETPAPNYSAARVDSRSQLSHPFKLLGFLSVDPYVAARETFYSKDHAGHDNVIRDIFSTGVDVYTKFYKVYDVETDFLNLDIHDIRHLIIPSVEYSFTDTPSIKPGDLFQFDGIDAVDYANSAKLSLQHKLQTKKRGEKVDTRETFDLLTFIAEGEYIFRDSLGANNELSDIIDYDLEIRPYRWMYIQADAKLNRRAGRLDTVNTNLYVNKGEDLTFSLGHGYTKHENNQIISSLRYDINKSDWRKHWGFDIYERYEIQEKTFQEQQYTVIKDLHCWTGELTCRIKEQNNFTFWVIFRLKAFPDLPFFFRTSYRGPTPGKKEKYGTSAGI